MSVINNRLFVKLQHETKKNFENACGNEIDLIVLPLNQYLIIMKTVNNSIESIHRKAAKFHGISYGDLICYLNPEEFVLQMNRKNHDFKKMNAAGVRMLDGSFTIPGQIEARERCLQSINFKLKNPSKSDVSPGMLQAWKEIHEKELSILEGLK